MAFSIKTEPVDEPFVKDSPPALEEGRGSTLESSLIKTEFPVDVKLEVKVEVKSEPVKVEIKTEMPRKRTRAERKRIAK